MGIQQPFGRSCPKSVRFVKMTIVFASVNEGKIKEIHQILGDDLIIKGLKDLAINEELPETGNSFQENARQKARYVFEKTKQTVFADDSGLCIDALNGAPGVHSAYYAGLPRNDEKNIQRVLQQLKNQPHRTAYFISVICLIWNGTEYFFEGKVHGHIAEEPRGNNGFGYDPIFIPKGYTQTFAELSASVKNSLSHRYQALRQLKHFLQQHTTC